MAFKDTTRKPYIVDNEEDVFIGLDLPIEVAPLRSSTSDILNLASIAAYSADVIDYNKD